MTDPIVDKIVEKMYGIDKDTEMIEDVEVSDEPFDRLTTLCRTMVDSIDTPENRDVQGIIFLHSEEDGGIEMFNYDSTAEGMADLLIHMKAMFTSMGKSFGVMTDQGIMLMDES